MNISPGYLYFISDEFFAKINDNYLKKNHPNTKRPHYIALKDNSSGLIWAVPCSAQYQKYENIIAKRRRNNKPTETIKIVNTQGVKQALLFQDMFPILPKYIDSNILLKMFPLAFKTKNCYHL